MDLRQLEMFLAVAENSSFTLASRQLYVAQSAISRKIKMLEEELGERLFSRINKRVHLTRAGESLVPHARRVFRDLRNAAMDISEIANLTKGVVKIGTGMTACMYLLPPVLEAFKSLYPNIETVVVTGSTDSLVEQVRSSALDIGILTLPIQFADLKAVPIRKEEMVVVCSKTHPRLAGRKTIRSAEIADFPLILWSKGASIRTLLDGFFARVGIEPRVAMESDSVATIKPLVAIDLGVSILPLPAVRAEAERGELHYLRIKDRQLTRRVGLVFPKTDAQPRVVKELIDLFQKHSG